jgi:hypothetical protein
MLPEVDDALLKLFRTSMTVLGAGTPGGVIDGQISFCPPDSEWVSDVNGLSPRRALNVYLAELRENRALRSTERLSTVDGGVAYRRPAPMRVDCQYLVSAWSPATDNLVRTLDEHEVLSEALEVLAREQVIEVGGAELPVTVAPPDGFAKLAEFWGTMGVKHRWKPVIPLAVTIPVEHAREIVAPEVTTRFTEYRPGTAAGGPGEVRLQIAGVVNDTARQPPVPVARAWVQLEEPGGAPVQATRTNSRGEFTFLDIPAGPYQLRVRAPGHGEPPVVPVTVPAPGPSGRYDLAIP